MRYCFMHLVQEDLSKIKVEWNSHTIRPNRHGNTASGVPDILYSMPETEGTPVVK